MGVVIVLLLVAAISYATVCTFTGLAPSAVRLDSYRPELGLDPRTFVGETADVQRAYTTGISRVAGASVVDESPGTILIDSKPTIRIMDGSFGLVVRVSFTQHGSTVSVATDAIQKVSFAWVWHPEMGLREVERSIRRAAHSNGATEAI